ncbi:MAG: FG-GAP-like repeat-containing protein [Planctomycetia bacterium]|nr:FG-GAP-like repeat-containing protein [Planctomycetia bacterium]
MEDQFSVVVLVGGDGNDSLFGGLGSDLLIGGSGDDLLFGGAGNDRLNGEAGRDMLTGNAGFDSLFGGDDADTLRGGAQNNVLDGGDGFDQVLEIADNDFTLTPSQLIVQQRAVIAVDPNAAPVVGSPLDVGTSVVLPSNADQLINIESASLLGGVSSNRLDASKFTGPVTLRGFNGDDTLIGGSNDDSLDGGDGNDQLNGSEGDDLFTTDEGNDQFDGGTGFNRLLADGDVDWRLTSKLLLGMGTDSFVNIGLAELHGGASANRLNAAKFTGQVTLIGGDGDDTLIGSDQNDVLIGGGGNDQLIAKGGNDSLTGGDGDNKLNGGPGIDRVVESGDTDFTLTPTQLSRTGTPSRQVDTSNNAEVTSEETGRSARPTELWSIEEAELTGGAGNNRLSAKKFGGAVTLRGGDGNDTLEGGSVADVLDGGAGRDRLLGRAGDDTLLGGSEKDLLLGGDGNDQLSGGDGADVLNGEAGADHSMGDSGNDRFEGDFASDTLDGGEGRDAFELKSSGDITLTDTALTWTATATLSQLEQVTLRGDADSQRLDASGFSGSTTLDGVAGDDTLLGARGNDLLLVASLNTSTVDGGAGFNTLARSGAISSGESSYDLTTNTTNLVRISQIDLRGPDVVSVSLDATKLLLKSGRGNTLELQLDPNDRLTLTDPVWTQARRQFGPQHLIQATRHLEVSAGVAIQQSSATHSAPGIFLKSAIENTFTYGPTFADLDGDGDLDAISQNGQLSFAQADGLFIAGASSTFEYNPKLADIDGDGDIDIIRNAIWKNDGMGVFIQSSVPVYRGEIVAIEDMDGDRDLDIVSASGGNAQASNPHLEIWSNDGTGTFTLTRLFENVTWAALSRPTDVVDVDGDGDLDIYQAAPTVAKSHLWLNRGNGEFNRSARPGLFGEGVSSVTWGDIDGDGDADAIVKTDKTSVWWNNKGVFSRGTQDLRKAVAGGIASPTLADFDNDGDQDIVTQMSTGEWTVLINQNGRFEDLGYRLGQMTSGSYASDVRVADVNTDGRTDLLFGLYGSWNAWLNLGELQTVTLPTAGGRFVLTRDGEQFVLKTESGTELTRGPIAGKTLLVAGSAVADQLVVDVSQGNPLPKFGLSFRGTAGNDGLELTGGSVDSVGYEINRGRNNRVRVGDRWIELSAIESLSDGLIAADRKFKANYSVTLSAGESPTDGLMRLDIAPDGDTQPLTRIDFAVPSNSLSIEGDSYRTIRMASVDDSLTGMLSASNAETIDASALSIPVTLSNGTVLLGGSGNDTLVSLSTRLYGFLWSTNSKLIGGAGDDTISGTGNLIGGEGNDSLTGGAGSDLLDGGSGNDTLNGGGGHDLLLGRIGADLLDGGDGDDVLLADLEAVHWIDGAEDSSAIPDVEQLVDTLLGGAGDDALIAGLGADLLDGQAGIDTLSGLDADDVIANSEAADRVAELAQRQIVFRQGTIYNRDHWVIPVAGEKLEINVSQPGSKVVVLSDSVPNELAGELPSNAIDKIVVLGSPQAEDIDMSQLYARSFAFLGAGDDKFIGSQNETSVMAGAGNDSVFGALNSRADIRGGDGNDLLFAGPYGGQLLGNAGEDTLVGTANGIYFSGGDGNDVLIGEVGNDYLSADAGDDLVLGGAGNDTVFGGSGVDTIDGGSGTNSNYEKDPTDVVNGGRVGFFDVITGRLSIYCAEKVVLRADVANGQLQILVAGVADAGLGSVPVSAIQSVLVFGSSAADSIDLSALTIAATVYGGSGNDTIIGTQSADIINGGFDNDSINGGSGDDTLLGNDGNDTLNGDAGRDVLNSGTGKDSLNAGADND